MKFFSTFLLYVDEMSKNKSNLKDADLATVAGLDTALRMEKEKYAKCPVKPDRVANHEIYQAWGYVICGYFLLEESFKLLIHIHGSTPDLIHTLNELFLRLPEDDKDLLREYYDDFRGVLAFENNMTFPFTCLDDFLTNLDGVENKGKHFGSFDWRYYLIENPKSMPMVSIEFLHEVIFGTLRIAEYAVNDNFEPSQYVYSLRKRQERMQIHGKFWCWMTVRMNSEGWEELGDRLEIIWGPDYKNRYDMSLFKGGGRKNYFCEKPEDFDLPIVDKRAEVAEFDPEEGFRNIGMTFT
ncbi:MAG: hypothetical protein OXH16_18185 [Gemmatimonadetes bacterium]|nr:hypothetical protein [Gemmatimonadota bacterium]